MQDERRGEIAIKVLKYKLRRDGFRLSFDFYRGVDETAKAIGIPFNEAMEFVEVMIRELIEDIVRDGKAMAFNVSRAESSNSPPPPPIDELDDVTPSRKL